jgi:hypothetical protein
MAPIFVYEVWNGPAEDGEALTRIRILAGNTLEVELLSYSDNASIELSPKQAREFARDLNAAAKVASSK